MADQSALYWMDPRFERTVVTMSCRSQRFWARLGHAVDPECLNLPEGTQALRAARQIATDTGAGPEGVAIVLQRLRRWMDEGKVKYEEILAVGDLFLANDEDPVLSEEAVVAELAPVLRKRLRHEVVVKVMDEAKDDTGFEKASELIKKANTLGDEKVADVGIKVGEGSYDQMESVRHVERLSTGIEDLDQLLKGGPRRGGFTVWLGSSGSGKSMALIHRTARAMRLGMTCALATLELTMEVQLARLKANLTGVPIDDILDDPRCVQTYLAKLKLGACYVQTFTSNATTVGDLFEWVDMVEQREGARCGKDRVPVDYLAVDYADLLTLPSDVGKEGDSGYQVGKHVYGGLRVYAEGEKQPKDGGHPGGPMWVDTACAAQRVSDKRKRHTTENVSDSAHKARRTTLMVSINSEEDTGMTEFYVAKNSHGAAKFTVGPLPSDFAVGRIAPVIED